MKSVGQIMRECVDRAVEKTLFGKISLKYPTVWDWLFPWRASRWQRQAREKLLDYLSAHIEIAVALEYGPRTDREDLRENKFFLAMFTPAPIDTIVRIVTRRMDAVAVEEARLHKIFTDPNLGEPFDKKPLTEEKQHGNQSA